MREKLRTLTLLVAAMLLTALPRAASADAVTYASGKRTLRVGILLVDSTIDNSTPTTLAAGPENPDPYVFQIADQRKDVKPLGWEFVNPLAPRTVTQDVLTRWTARDPNNPYQLGANITKDMAAYWEVSLSKTAVADLIQFDALLLTTHRLLKFSPADREKLRKLVDAGGLLWLDDCGGMRMSAQGPFFLEQLQFQGSRGAVGSGTPVVFQPGHALLNAPYRLSLPQIALLGEYTDYRDRALAAIDPVTGMDVSQAPNPSILTNVVGNLGVGGGLPYIATASYGSGTVVATCGDTGCAINDYVGGTYNNVASGPNSGAYMRGARLERAHEEDLLFLYNLTQLGAANNTYRRNNRRVGTSGESLRAPLTTAFDFTQAGTPTDAKVNSASAPLVARDRVYVSGIDSNGQLTVRCYNAKPSFNRGDQGVPDLAFGAPYDEVWRSAPIPNPSNRQPSSPVLGTVFQGGGSYRDYIFVTTGDGSLIKLDALPTDNAGNPLPLNIAAGNPVILKGSPATYTQCKLASDPPSLISDPNNSKGPAPAPVFHENRVYVVQPDGVVRCIEANAMVSLWTSIDVAITPKDVTPTGSPTLGVVRLDDLSGGNRNSGNVGARSGGNTSDIMLYVPVITEDSNTGNNIAKILPFWLGTRHEVIENPSAPGDYNTRVAVGANAVWVANTVANPLPYFIRPKARVYDNRANMEAGIESLLYTNNAVTDAGLVQVRDGANNPPPPGTPLIVSVDYDLLYVPVGPGPGVPPGLAAGSDGSRPSGNGPALLISDYMGGLETTALGPDDIQFFAARASSGASGSGQTKSVFLGAREQFGIGATKLRQSFTVLENVGNIAVPMEFEVNGQTRTVIERATFRFPFSGFSPLGPGSSAGVLPENSVVPFVEVTPVGPPIIASETGVAYQLFRGTAGGNFTILAAFDADRDVTLRIKPYNPNAPVQIAQANGMTHPGDATNPVRTITATLSPNNGNNNVSNAVLDGDADAGRITIRNMVSQGGRFSSSQSFVVSYTPQGGTQPITEVISPSARLQTINNGVNDVADTASLPQDYNPLLWYYALPVTPTGAASRVGDMIYIPTQSGIVAVDSDPAATDPDVRAGEAVRNVFDSLTRLPGGTPINVAVNHVRWVQRLGDGAVPSVAAITAGPDILVANTLSPGAPATDWRGTFAYENSTTLIADSNRIIEVGGDGTPLWAMDGTVDSKTVGGAQPIFDPTQPPPPDLARTVTERRGLTRPSVARRLSSNDYLIADTGNGRIVRATRAAAIRQEINRLNDPYNVLEPTDPKSLNNPTDVQLYVQPTFDPADPFNLPVQGYEEHYLIADSGNFRVIEVVDYRDNQGRIRPNGEKVVVWSSKTYSKQGRKFSFKSVQRTYVTEGNVSGIPQLIAVIDNATASGGSASADFTGGSIVKLDYRPLNTLFVLRNATTGAVLPLGAWPVSGFPIQSGYPWPLVPATDEPATNGLVAQVVESFTFKAGTEITNPMTGATDTVTADYLYHVTRPTFFQQLTLRGGTGPNGIRVIYLICDANGVYQLEKDAGGVLVATWFMNKADYDRINRLRVSQAAPTADAIDPMELPKFHPVSAQRLPNGNILIANAASGPSGLFEDGKFRGEVLEVTGGLRFVQLPGVPEQPRFGNFATPSWSVKVPSAAPRRATVTQRMGAASATHPLEQPLFADRL